MNILKKIWDGFVLFGSLVIAVFLGFLALMFMCGVTHGSCYEESEFQPICSLIGFCDAVKDSEVE